MSDEKIIKYYLLCTVRMGGKKHIVSDVLKKNQIVIISEHDMNIFFRKQNNNLVAKDVVVGGTKRKIQVY